MTDNPVCATPRTAVLVGPYLSGKTSLLEALLYRTGAIARQGSVNAGTTVGDAAQEARDRNMSIELAVAEANYLGDDWVFIDCPGSVEFSQDARSALMVADIAILVAEPDPDRASTLAPTLHYLDANDIPHILFVNKTDHSDFSPGNLLEALQAISERPLVLRQVPIHGGEAGQETVAGIVDLVSERAFCFREGEPSALVKLPESVAELEQTARGEMLEVLADFDDTLLEALLEDITPSTEEIYKQLTQNLRQDRIVPVLMGSAEKDSGLTRLLKLLRHEVPDHKTAAARRGIEDLDADGPLLEVFKTYHLPHAGKVSMARLWRGKVQDGDVLGSERISGLYRMTALTQDKRGPAGPGAVVGLGRMDSVQTGQLLTSDGSGEQAVPWPEALQPVYARSIRAKNRNDEVKLTAAIAKLSDEDPCLILEQNPLTRQVVLRGQGSTHLQVAVDRLKSRFHLEVEAEPPLVAYQETIRGQTSQHSRHKRQSGGHGQFADVHVDIAPQARGEGFAFRDTIVGGVVPKQFIPSVEAGIRDSLGQGPLGFPVVDIVTTLTNGQFHPVDSSDMAFRTAGRLSMTEGLPKCTPVLLEPIHQVTINVPSDYTAKIQRIVSQRRGQIQGFDSKPGWKGWDEVKCLLPEAEMLELIIELRSATQGVGSFHWKLVHMAELVGKQADRIVEDRKAALQG